MFSFLYFLRWAKRVKRREEAARLTGKSKTPGCAPKIKTTTGGAKIPGVAPRRGGTQLAACAAGGDMEIRHASEDRCERVCVG